jgi:hypothetical protein
MCSSGRNPVILLDLAVLDRARNRLVDAGLLSTGLCRVQTKLVLLRPVCRSWRLSFRECYNVNESVNEKKMGKLRKCQNGKIRYERELLTIRLTISSDDETNPDRYDENKTGSIQRKRKNTGTTGRERESIRRKKKREENLYNEKTKRRLPLLVEKEVRVGAPMKEPPNRW